MRSWPSQTCLKYQCKTFLITEVKSHDSHSSWLKENHVTWAVCAIWVSFSWYFLSFTEIYIFIHQGHIKLIKRASTDIYKCNKRFLFQINAVLLNFLFICESWKIKSITVSTKILCSTTVSNIDNNQKYFLSSKSAYYYDFWRSCDTEDWSNDAENSAVHHRNKLHF